MQTTTTPTPHDDTIHRSPEPAGRRAVVCAPGEGEALWFLHNLVLLKVGAPQGAPFTVMEIAFPEGSHTPFHAHHDEDEAFYVLEGRLTFLVSAGPPGEVRTVTAGAGTYVHVPRGVAHGFRTEAPSRMLVLAGREGFVDLVRGYGVGAPRRELPPAAPADPARLVELAARSRIEVLGPLPA